MFLNSVPTSTPIEDKSTTLTPFLSLLNYSANNSGTAPEDHLDNSGESKRKKRRSFGSLSKVFSIGRTRRSIAVPTNLDLEGKLFYLRGLGPYVLVFM